MGERQVRHDDLGDVTSSEEWQVLCLAISNVLNKFYRGTDRSDESAMRLLALALQVAPIASTCKQCRPNAQWLWPVGISGGNWVIAAYSCDRHPVHTFGYDAEILNQVDISGLA